MSTGTLYRLSAFTTNPEGGNPAGVWVGDSHPEPAEMQRIAAEVGYSETAFIAPASGRERSVRYFSPQAEVPFCGHATIASAALLGELDGDGTYLLETKAGRVAVDARARGDVREASLTSVTPAQTEAPDSFVDQVLDALGWSREDLDAAIPPVRAYAGAWHLVLAARDRERLDRLEYDFETVRQLMLADGLTTLMLIWRESTELIHARNPFPVGGVIEDPATGAAAAALGGYLRAAGLITPPATILIRQGEAMGRPSRIVVDIPREGGIVVTGSAVHIGKAEVR